MTKCPECKWDMEWDADDEAWASCPNCDLPVKFWSHHAELRAQIAAKRIAQDQVEMLERELKTERLLADEATRLNTETGRAFVRAVQERDEARQIARGLLRLARALRQEYSLPLSMYPHVQAALAALPEGVRRLLD